MSFFLLVLLIFSASMGATIYCMDQEIYPPDVPGTPTAFLRALSLTLIPAASLVGAAAVLLNRTERGEDILSEVKELLAYAFQR